MTKPARESAGIVGNRNQTEESYHMTHEEWMARSLDRIAAALEANALTGEQRAIFEAAMATYAPEMVDDDVEWERRQNRLTTLIEAYRLRGGTE